MLELLLTKAPQSPATSLCVIIQMCVCVCLCPRLCFFLCGVITVCPALRRVHVYPAWSLSCHRGSHSSVITTATDRRTEPASMSPSNAACSAYYTLVRRQAEWKQNWNVECLKSKLNCLPAWNSFLQRVQTKKMTKWPVDVFFSMLTCSQWKC